jgi:hypothetical protein
MYRPNKYLNEIISYGGEPSTRTEAILHMQSIGATQPMIDRWLQGNDLAQRPCDALTTRSFLNDDPPVRKSRRRPVL